MSRLSVLIAEDDLDDQEFIKDAFARNCVHCDLEFVQNGMELTTHLEHKQNTIPPALPSLILLDLNMPLKSGYEALEEIKNDSRLKDIPVIVVTASTSQKEEMNCRKMGCNNFFNKPLSVREYDELIQKILYWTTEHQSKAIA